MRIYCAIRHSLDPRRFYSSLWPANFFPALRKLGHDVVESTVDLDSASQFMEIAGGFTPEERAVRGELTQRILDDVRAAHRQRPVDVFLGYFYNAHFEPAGFAQLHALGIRTINFYCNSVYQFELVREVAAAVEHSWHPEKHARDLYLAAGARPVHVQMGADPEVYRPVPEIARAPDVCFIGQRYADRDLWLAALARAGVPLTVHGHGWAGPAGPGPAVPAAEGSRYGRVTPSPGSFAAYRRLLGDQLARHGAVGGLRRIAAQALHRRRSGRARRLVAAHARGPAPEPLREAFAAHELALNLSNVWADGRPGSRLIPHVRLRDFEAPMCGACFLTGDSDEIRELYEVGKEIETYAEPGELVDKARFLLRNPAVATAMRTRGSERARADHTWERRFVELFTRIGGR